MAGRTMVALRARELVQVVGYHEAFRVVHVDEANETVDLACIERVGFLTRVPVSLVRPLEAS